MSNSVQSSLNPSHPRLIQALEFCSLRLDGELAAGEVDLMANGDGDVALRAEEFVRNVRRLSRLMKSVPVVPVGRRVLDGISARAPEFLASEFQTVGPQVRPDRAAWSGFEKRRFRSSNGWALSFALTMTLASLMLISFMITEQSWPETAEHKGSIAAKVAASGERPASPVPLQRDDLQVLVLRVGTADREAVIRLVRSVAVANGLEVQSLEERPDRVGDPLGIILTSTDAGSQAVSFVDGMAEADVVRSWEWNPTQLDAKARRKLVTAIRQSMLNPTASELHFGEVYLAVPGHGGLMAAHVGTPQITVSGPELSELSGLSGSASGTREAARTASQDDDAAAAGGMASAAPQRQQANLAEKFGARRSETDPINEETASGKAVRPAGHPVLVLFEFGEPAEPRHRSL